MNLCLKMAKTCWPSSISNHAFPKCAPIQILAPYSYSNHGKKTLAVISPTPSPADRIAGDIAAIYGKEAVLTHEQMLYCLFRHAAAQAFRDLVVRVGERVLIRRASLRVLQMIAQKVGIRITHQVIGKSISRWLPLVGAVSVGAYAYFDTDQVATTAIALFERELDIEPEANENP